MWGLEHFCRCDRRISPSIECLQRVFSFRPKQQTRSTMPSASLLWEQPPCVFSNQRVGRTADFLLRKAQPISSFIRHIDLNISICCLRIFICRAYFAHARECICRPRVFASGLPGGNSRTLPLLQLWRLYADHLSSHFGNQAVVAGVPP